MIRIEFTKEEKEKLHMLRYEYPDPIVQRKIDVLHLVSKEISYQEIARLCNLDVNTITAYVKAYKLDFGLNSWTLDIASLSSKKEV